MREERQIDFQSDVALSQGMSEAVRSTKWAGRKLIFYKETDSTNEEAKRLAENGAPHGTLVMTESQSAGRGRKGRSWETMPGEAVSMTLLLRPEFVPDKASGLTLVMALAAARALREVCDCEFTIKWPNDIILNRRKVCGILTEMSIGLPEARVNRNGALSTIRYVVIGVGINVSQTEFPDEIRETATSIRKETGRTVSRMQIVERVMYYFEQYYEIYCTTQDLSELCEEYNAILVNRNAAVKVLDPKGAFTGTARGITPDGELIVEKENGEAVSVYAGEVSVRGLYGYAE